MNGCLVFKVSNNNSLEGFIIGCRNILFFKIIFLLTHIVILASIIMKVPLVATGIMK